MRTQGFYKLISNRFVLYGKAIQPRTLRQILRKGRTYRRPITCDPRERLRPRLASKLDALHVAVENRQPTQVGKGNQLGEAALGQLGSANR